MLDGVVRARPVRRPAAGGPRAHPGKKEIIDPTPRRWPTPPNGSWPCYQKGARLDDRVEAARWPLGRPAHGLSRRSQRCWRTRWNPSRARSARPTKRPSRPASTAIMNANLPGGQARRRRPPLRRPLARTFPGAVMRLKRRPRRPAHLLPAASARPSERTNALNADSARSGGAPERPMVPDPMDRILFAVFTHENATQGVPAERRHTNRRF